MKMPIHENGFNKGPDNGFPRMDILDNNFGKSLSDTRFNKCITDMFHKNLGPEKSFKGLDFVNESIMKAPNIDLFTPPPSKYSPIGFPRNRLPHVQVNLNVSLML